MPKMIISIDGVVIKEVQLTKDRTTLGRRPYNDIVIDNLAVSGEHAVLQMGPGGVMLEDLNSTNGTYVNGKSVKRQFLHHNDAVEIGKYKIRYLDEAPAASFEKTMEVQPPAAAAAGIAPPIPPTVPVTLGEPGGEQRAVIKVMSGAAAGREVALVKVVTTIGKPGVAVAAITRRTEGYVVAHIDGEDPPRLNGNAVGADPVGLHNGDLLELAGTQMQFIQA
ncbi:FHA domain-containing protein [Ramlibacter sp. MAHUQ-53]|uniref:FHA domain-containing protein n=1 Tax=unclassified Ramlibacter TaxID=2617605 RepID=UPI00363BC413